MLIILWTWSVCAVFLFPNFIKRARLTPLAGRFWTASYMFDTPGLNDTRYIIERFGNIYVCHGNDINFPSNIFKFHQAGRIETSSRPVLVREPYIWHPWIIWSEINYWKIWGYLCMSWFWHIIFPFNFPSNKYPPTTVSSLKVTFVIYIQRTHICR